MNPIEIIEPSWKEKKIKNYKKVKKFLETYKWSSLQNIIGKPIFPSLVDDNEMLKFFETFENFEKYFWSFINEFCQSQNNMFGGIQDFVFDYD